MKKLLSQKQIDTLLKILNARFEKNMNRHQGVEWANVEARLKANPDKLWSLNEMENSGGEPDVVLFDKKTGEYTFYDCSPESPIGRRSYCYDKESLDARKENKPKNNVIEVAKKMGIELLNEEEYRYLQKFGPFDSKTSSWLKTPRNIRELDGAIFGDFRFDTVFIYHNGVQSYYAGRGFRGSLKV